MADSELPGVEFTVKSTAFLGKTLRKTTRVEVVLGAEFADDDLWEAVKGKLHGLKVYAAEDFKGEMLASIREDYARLEATNRRLEHEKKQLEEDNLRMSGALGVLHRQIESG